MIENSRESNVGLDLGIWTMVSTICRGAGVLLGTVIFDVLARVLGMDNASAFGLVFALEAILMMAALGVLALMFAPQSKPQRTIEPELVLNASMD